MKIRLGELKKIIREEVTRTLSEAAVDPNRDPEALFKLMVKSSPKFAPQLASAWDSLKSGTPFEEVAQDLYDTTQLKITGLARIEQGGPGLGLEKIDPEKLASVESMISASTMTGEDLVTQAEEQMKPRQPVEKPKRSGDPNDPYADMPYFFGRTSGPRQTFD